MDNNKDAKAKSSNCNKNNSNQTINLGLDSFSYADFVLLSSTLAYVIGEELSDEDIGLIILFLSMVSTDLALITAKRGILQRKQGLQTQNGETSVVIDTTTTEADGALVAGLPRKSKIKKKKIYKKKKRKKQLD